MYKQLLQKLESLKLVNLKTNKVSPWINRKITEDLKHEIYEKTSFIEYDMNLSDRISIMILNIKEHPKCLNCGNPNIYHRSLKGFTKYCSKTCADSSEEKSIRIKELYQEGIICIGHKSIEKQREKYNGLIAIQADKTVLEKIKETSIKNYGVDNPAKSETIKQKISKNTTGKKKHFNDIKPTQTNKTKEQIYLLENVECAYNKWLESNLPITAFSENMGFSKTTLYGLFVRNGYFIPIIKGKGTNISKKELEIINWLESLNIKVVSQYKLENKKIDIFLPDYNLAIEYNGPDHSFGKSNYSRFDNYQEEDCNIHLNRLLLCEKYNIDLIQIFENEWNILHKKDIWKSIIKNKLKIFENKIFVEDCEITIIEPELVKEFLNQNDIKGYKTNSTINLGLSFNNELISIMSFNNEDCWKLINYCNKINYTIINGAETLFKYFIDNYNPNTIVSHCDRRIFKGNLYKQLGFNYIENSPPNYYYFTKKNLSLISKEELKSLLLIYDTNLSETDNMYNNGYRKIWDCGNLIYQWNNNDIK